MLACCQTLHCNLLLPSAAFNEEHCTGLDLDEAELVLSELDQLLIFREEQKRRSAINQVVNSFCIPRGGLSLSALKCNVCSSIEATLQAWA